MLSRIVNELDQRILKDPRLDQRLFDELIASQRELGLVYGERPTCPFLRPHIMSRSQYDEVTRAAQTIAVAVEKVVARALIDEDLLKVLALTDRERQMARIDPGYSCLCITSRLDAYVTDLAFHFLEYNAETPAGVGDQMQLEKVLFGLNHVKQLLQSHAHWRPEPHRRLLASLLAAYREWGGEEERPQIAIVDWKGVATESEFRILQQYFQAEGYQTVIADPGELRYDGEYLEAGDFRIDILYKRVVIYEFLERCDEHHPLARAYADGHICMVNSFRTKIAHKKASFAILSDPQFANLFNPQEIEVFRRHVPWTRRLAKGVTTFHGAENDLIELLHREQDSLVLKPNDDYGGHGVFLGWETSPDEWEGAISLALERPYVVQERVPMKKVSMPTFSDQVRMEELYVDFNPFLFHNEAEGALIRLSSSSLMNVTTGGGQTALLILEDM
ncbi:MAG: circularly permuted type 2 ATP-grasp protein [Acidobacteriota bacterium]